MKTYKEALARVQELIDEKRSNENELEKLDSLLFNAKFGSDEGKILSSRSLDRLAE